MNSIPKRIKLDHDDENLWKIGVCCLCNVILDTTSKLLVCLHGICKNCISKIKVDLGVPCNICKTVTVKKLLDYPAALIKFKLCTNLLCLKESKFYCILCREVFCNSCSFEHKNFNKEHKHIIEKDNESIFDELKVNNDQCPNCYNKPVEVVCIDCSTIQCALCQLKHHEHHTYKSLDVLTKQTKDTFVSERNDLELNAKRIDHCIELMSIKNNDLREKYMTCKTQILKIVDQVNKEIRLRGTELSLNIDKHFEKQFAVITTNKLMLEKLKNKNEYYSDFISTIVDHNTSLYDSELTTIIMDKLSIVKTCINTDTPELLSTISPNFTFDYMDIFNTIIENIKSVGKITSPKILDLLSIIDHDVSLGKIEILPSMKHCIMEAPSLSSDIGSPEITSLSNILDNTELVGEGTSSNYISNNNASKSRNPKRALNINHIENRPIINNVPKNLFQRPTSHAKFNSSTNFK